MGAERGCEIVSRWVQKRLSLGYGRLHLSLVMSPEPLSEAGGASVEGQPTAAESEDPEVLLSGGGTESPLEGPTLS